MVVVALVELGLASVVDTVGTSARLSNWAIELVSAVA